MTIFLLLVLHQIEIKIIVLMIENPQLNVKSRILLVLLIVRLLHVEAPSKEPRMRVTLLLLPFANVNDKPRLEPKPDNKIPRNSHLQ